MESFLPLFELMGVSFDGPFRFAFQTPIFHLTPLDSVLFEGYWTFFWVKDAILLHSVCTPLYFGFILLLLIYIQNHFQLKNQGYFKMESNHLPLRNLTYFQKELKLLSN